MESIKIQRRSRIQSNEGPSDKSLRGAYHSDEEGQLAAECYGNRRGMRRRSASGKRNRSRRSRSGRSMSRRRRRG